MTIRFLLLLVTLVPTLCHSTEYCVRPTDSSSAPFHNGHTCQTLNQYINDSVHYFTSNTRFRFLPGKHEVNALVIIQDIENVSLEAFNSSAPPLVVPHFSCRCDDPYTSECSQCSAFRFQNVTNVSFKGIDIIPQNVRNVQFKLNITYAITMTLANSVHISNTTVMGGIFINSTNGTTISCAVIYNTILNGILIKGYASNTIIVNTTIANTSFTGIYVESADGTLITNTSVVNCGFDGIHFIQSTNFTVKYTGIFKSSRIGIGLWNSEHFLIENIVVHSNPYNIYIQEAEEGTVKSAKVNVMDFQFRLKIIYGIAVILTRNVYLSNITVMGGITIQGANGTTISSAVIYNTIEDGIFIQGLARNSKIMNTTVINTSLSGIYVESADGTVLTNTNIVNCGFHGIQFSHSTNSIVRHTHIFNSSGVGIGLWNSRHFVINNIVVVNSNLYGIYMNETEDGNVKNAKVNVLDLQFRLSITYGIALLLTKNVYLSNITVMGGIIVQGTNGTTISRAMIYNTTQDGIFIQGLGRNTRIVNTTVVNTSLSGINVESADGTVITNTSIMYCGFRGIQFSHSTNSTVRHTHIFNSSELGIGLWNSKYFVITNILVANSNHFGIFMNETENGTIKNAKVLVCFQVGVMLYSSSNTVLREVVVHDSIHRAAFLYNVTNVTISNTTTLNSNDDGIVVIISRNVIIRNIRVLLSLRVGLVASYSVNISFHNATVLDSAVAIYVGFSTNVTIAHVKMDNSSSSGIFIANSKNTSVKNTTIKRTKRAACSELVGATMDSYFTTNLCVYYGIWMDESNGTLIANTAIQGGILILRAEHTLLWYTTVSVTTGILILLSNHTNIHNSNIVSNMSLRRKYQTVMVIQSSHIMFSNVSFSGFTGLHHTSIAYLSAVLGLETTTDAVLNGCTFANNYVSALKVTHSALSLSGNVSFINNHAIKGGAIIMTQESFLNIAPKGNVIFEGNSASYGGAIYIEGSDRQVVYETTEHNGSISSQPKYHPCFLTGDKSHKSLFFTNNTAEFGGNVLYGGDLEGAYANENSQEQCITFFRSISSITPHNNQLSLITSEPSRVCHCSSSYRPDCYTLSKAVSAYPGQTTTISAVLVGQGLGTVAGSVFAAFLDDVYQPSLDKFQETQQVFQDQCYNLSYTIFAQQDDVEVVLALTASKNRVSLMTNETASEAIEIYNQHNPNECPFEFLQLPIYVHITLLPCPPGFQLSGSPASCNCIELLQTLPGVTCSIQDQTVARSGLVWIGATTGDDQSITIMAADYCPLQYCRGDPVNISVYQLDSQCNYGHSGTLCGGCPSNFSSVLGSAQCLPCSNKYLSLVIPFTLAGFLLVFFIKIFDLTVSSGTIHGVIFYANVIKVNEAIFLPQGERSPLSVFISWINLDLGIQTCFFNGLNVYWKTWLQFVFPFYVWIIAGSIIIAAKHSRRVSKAMGNNSVPVLATLFLLSYAKLLRTVITALSYSVVKHPHGQKYVWSADGNIDYLGSQHAPLFVAAVAVLVFLYLPYTIFLLVGQWLHKCQVRPVILFMIKLKPFLDAHYGCLKEKYRFWFGTLLLMKAFILLLSQLIPFSNVIIVTYSLSITALALTLFQVLCPTYTVTAVSKFETSFFINLVALGLTTFYAGSAESQTVAAYVFISVAFSQFVGLLAFKVYNILKEKVRLWNKFMEWLTSFKKRGVDDELAFLDYDREAVELDAVCETDSSEEEDLRNSEDQPTYGF